MATEQRKNIIYPKNFFVSDDEIQEYEQGPQLGIFGKQSTEGQGSYNNKLITLRTEGDQLLLNQDSGFFKKSFLQRQNKLEIYYGEEDINITHESSIESGLMSRYYSEKLMILDYALMIFAIWQIIGSVIYVISSWILYETDFGALNQNATQYCLWLILICSAFENFTFSTYDYVDELTFEFKWNWLLTIFGWFRVYIIFRVLLKKTPYMNTRASRISRMYGCEADYSYAIKCLFKDYPIIISLIAFIFSLFVFGYCLFICEKPLLQVIPEDQQAFLFDSLQNSIWCVVITMTTIGYGDFFPKTMLGRGLDVLLTLWGTFIVSMMVIVLSNALAMTNQERRALLLLKRLQTRKILQNKAGLLLSGVAKYNNFEKEARNKGKKLLRDYFVAKSLDLRDKTKDFRDKKRKLKSMNEEDNLAEEMSREFDFIKEDVKMLNEQQEKLCKYIEENFDVEN